MSDEFYGLHRTLKNYGNDFKVVKRNMSKELSVFSKAPNQSSDECKRRIQEKYYETNAIMKTTFNEYIERLSSIVEVKDMMNIERTRNNICAAGNESLKKKYSLILNDYDYNPQKQQQQNFIPVTVKQESPKYFVHVPQNISYEEGKKEESTDMYSRRLNTIGYRKNTVPDKIIEDNNRKSIPIFPLHVRQLDEVSNDSNNVNK